MKQPPAMEQLRAALLRGDSGFRLVVPTATMAEHLRNQIAREGLLVRPHMVTTLSRFIEPWAAALSAVSGPVLYLLVDEAVRRLKRPEFSAVAHTPGFGAALARGIEEFSSAGCDAQFLAEFVNECQAPLPLGSAFAAVYREVEIELIARGAATRGSRLRRAAAAIRRDGAGAVSGVCFDGFHRLNQPERDLIDALRRHAEVVIAPTGETESPRAHLELFTAPVLEREVDEIARRILAHAAAGRSFREMGVVLRSPEIYSPLLAAAFERFGVPARFYFPSPLADHGSVRFLVSAVNAMLGGWDFEQTLSALRMEASGAGVSGAMDWFDFEVRKHFPARGLEKLRAIASADVNRGPRLLPLLDSLAGLETWRSARHSPPEWSTRCAGLAALVRNARPTDGAAQHQIEMFRGQQEALRGFAGAMDGAAQSFASADAAPFPEFWRRAQAAVRLTVLRIPDHRRDVVHVMSAFEARQWDLPVVFICGLLERQFPKHAQQDAFFPDAARRELNLRGVAVPTAAQLDGDERLLFHIAVARASAEAVLSYPEMDARGERNTPSFFLDRFNLQAAAARPIRKRRPDAPSPASSSGAIRDGALQQLLDTHHATLSPTGLEEFLQCPFKFFGSRTLRLHPAPPRPEDRLDSRVQGGIVHAVLAEWARARPEIEPLFDRIFEAACQANNLPRGYRREALRRQLLEDLLRYAADTARPPASSSETEVQFTTQIGGAAVRGRIDRIDRGSDGRSTVIDYKYSAQAQNYTRNESALQGPLYTLAAREMGHDVAGMYYCCLKGGVKYAEDSVTAGRLEEAAAAVARAAGEIRAGRVAPNPASLDKCRYCDFRHVCRYTAAQTSAAGGV